MNSYLLRNLSGITSASIEKYLLTKIDGQMRSISLHLPPDKHALACNAYRDDKEVCISGTIDKSGKYWFFTEVTEFTVI